MAVCNVTTCNKRTHSKGYCKIHYDRFRRHGDPNYVVKPLRKYGNSGICSVDNCELEHHSRGYCKKHYLSFKRYGDPEYVFKRQPKPRESTGFKRCPKCEQIKPTSEYYIKRDKRSSSGYSFQVYCRSCELERRKRDYWKNHEKEKLRVKRKSRMYGKHTTPESEALCNERKRAQRLSLRMVRCDLIIELCMKEYDIREREHLNGRTFILSKYYECAMIAAWLIRKHTWLSLDAIAELFDCATIDIIKRLKEAKKQHSWQEGDIIFRMVTERILKHYHRLKPTHFSQVEVKPYQEFSVLQRESKKNVPYAPIKTIPTGMTTDQLCNIVIWYYETDWETFLADNKRGPGPKARYVVSYLLHKYLGKSVEEIAKLFGRDVTTIMKSIKSGLDFVRNDDGHLFYEIHKRSRVDLENTRSHTDIHVLGTTDEQPRPLPGQPDRSPSNRALALG